MTELVDAPASYVQAMSEEMSEETPPSLTELEIFILHKISEQPQVTAKIIAQNMGVSARTVERTLQTLQKKGKLQRVGAKKGGAWLLC